MADQGDLFGPAPRVAETRRVARDPAPPPAHRLSPWAMPAAPATASERQASFAADIARGLGIPLPIRTDPESVGGFIERHRREFEEAARRGRRGGRP